MFLLPLLGRFRSWAASAPGPLPLLGRFRSWAASLRLSLLSLFTLSLLCASPAYAQTGGYPGGGSGGGYPGGGAGGGSGSGYPGGSGGADSYSVVYSGGNTTVTTDNYPPDPPVTNTTPYSASTSSNAPGAWGGGAFTYINGGGGSGSVTCAGQITATFTWNGGPNNDPPPISAVVTETVNVAWGGPNSTGSSDISGGTTPANQPPNYTATRYTVNGGSSFSVNCTPNASMSGISLQPYHTIGGSAYVGYTATASPVTIGLEGVTADPSDNSLHVLTGGQVTAFLNAPFTASNFSWSFTGATGYNPFYDWDPSAPNSSNPTQFVPIPSAYLAQGSISFYDAADGDGVTVKCAAAVTPHRVLRYP